jgi:DnaK suppressor protein
MERATQEQLGPLRVTLERRLEELRSALRSSARLQLSEATSAFGEVNDRKDVAEERMVASVADAAERLELEEAELVEAALRRWAEGRYGDCQGCGEPIALERLKVQPAASRCTACQAAHEAAHEPGGSKLRP